MYRLFVIIFVSVIFCGIASAGSIVCQDPNLPLILEDLLSGGEYADGCYVQDKLFTNFTYVRGDSSNPRANLVLVSFALTPGPNPPSGDLHTIGFQAIGGTSWQKDFSISYTISVYNPPVLGLGIVQAGLDINGKSGDALSETLTGQNNYSYSINAVCGTPGLAQINGETVLRVVNANNSNVQGLLSIYNSFTQGVFNVPEPGILILLGISMVSIAGLRRFWK